MESCSINKQIADILSSEAKIAKCLQDLLCNGLVEDLKNVEPIEKRTSLTKEILCAYSCKEKAMGDLINSLKCFKNSKSQNHCCNKHENDSPIFIITLLIIYFLYIQGKCC